MKRWLRILLWILFALGVLFVIVVSNQSQDSRVIKRPEIIIHVSGENAFLNEHELFTRLKRRGYIFNGQIKKDRKSVV